MSRTTKQLQAYCKHAIKNGLPRDQIISELSSETANQDIANRMYADILRATRKSALIIFVVGVTLSSSHIALVMWAGSSTLST